MRILDIMQIICCFYCTGIARMLKNALLSMDLPPNYASGIWNEDNYFIVLTICTSCTFFLVLFL
jgi:hypothetical protein